jgi:hypothetical protein
MLIQALRDGGVVGWIPELSGPDNQQSEKAAATVETAAVVT